MTTCFAIILDLCRFRIKNSIFVYCYRSLSSNIVSIDVATHLGQSPGMWWAV